MFLALLFSLRPFTHLPIGAPTSCRFFPPQRAAGFPALPSYTDPLFSPSPLFRLPPNSTLKYLTCKYAHRIVTPIPF